ncbi:hypothetical protein LY90DRAFT_515967 [Neocallimastix californiae]|uniref:Ankyrin n=1 Tax=Neocallimastix californiae TaxID=1754190 RepID=A0A1Y2AGE2_9FUNG|nr:hypothetical protein LY90DRAFT_515967 [Neocallimastix californiae]|eukprot:ORY21663.1 hypothetical protein LY90DRAFT_515967 [Neocallimastix californiae]
MKRMQTEDIIIDKQRLVLELLQKNNINKLNDFINNIKIPFYFLNSSNFDLLITTLSLNCSLDIIKLIYDNCNYKTLNYEVRHLFHLYDTNNNNYTNYANNLNKAKELMYINNCLKSPLLVPLENSDFQIAEFLINKGADIYYKINNKHILEILNEENLLT